MLNMHPTGGRGRSVAWSYFTKYTSPVGRVRGTCNYCGKDMVPITERMINHLVTKCPEIPLDIKLSLPVSSYRTSYRRPRKSTPPLQELNQYTQQKFHEAQSSESTTSIIVNNRQLIQVSEELLIEGLKNPPLQELNQYTQQQFHQAQQSSENTTTVIVNNGEPIQPTNHFSSSLISADGEIITTSNGDDLLNGLYAGGSGSSASELDPSPPLSSAPPHPVTSFGGGECHGFQTSLNTSAGHVLSSVSGDVQGHSGLQLEHHPDGPSAKRFKSEPGRVSMDNMTSGQQVGARPRQHHGQLLMTTTQQSSFTPSVGGHNGRVGGGGGGGPISVTTSPYGGMSRQLNKYGQQQVKYEPDVGASSSSAVDHGSVERKKRCRLAEARAARMLLMGPDSQKTPDLSWDYGQLVDLLAAVAPEFHPPTRNTIANEYLGRVREATQRAVDAKIQAAKALVLSVDVDWMPGTPVGCGEEALESGCRDSSNTAQDSTSFNGDLSGASPKTNQESAVVIRIFVHAPMPLLYKTKVLPFRAVCSDGKITEAVTEGVREVGIEVGPERVVGFLVDAINPSKRCADEQGCSTGRTDTDDRVNDHGVGGCGGGDGIGESRGSWRRKPAGLASWARVGEALKTQWPWLIVYRCLCCLLRTAAGKILGSRCLDELVSSLNEGASMELRETTTASSDYQLIQTQSSNERFQCLVERILLSSAANAGSTPTDRHVRLSRVISSISKLLVTLCKTMDAVNRPYQHGQSRLTISQAPRLMTGLKQAAENVKREVEACAAGGGGGAHIMKDADVSDTRTRGSGVAVNGDFGHDGVSASIDEQQAVDDGSSGLFGGLALLTEDVIRELDSWHPVAFASAVLDPRNQAPRGSTVVKSGTVKQERTSPAGGTVCAESNAGEQCREPTTPHQAATAENDPGQIRRGLNFIDVFVEMSPSFADGVNRSQLFRELAQYRCRTGDDFGRSSVWRSVVTDGLEPLEWWGGLFAESSISKLATTLLSLPFALPHASLGSTLELARQLGASAAEGGGSSNVIGSLAEATLVDLVYVRHNDRTLKCLSDADFMVDGTEATDSGGGGGMTVKGEGFLSHSHGVPNGPNVEVNRTELNTWMLQSSSQN